eukprot:1422079-Prymnesium_polylepis.1
MGKARSRKRCCSATSAWSARDADVDERSVCAFNRGRAQGSAAVLLLHCERRGRDVCRACVNKLRAKCIDELKRLKHLALVRNAVLDWLVAPRGRVDDLFCVEQSNGVLVSRGDAAAFREEQSMDASSA